MNFDYHSWGLDSILYHCIRYEFPPRTTHPWHQTLRGVELAVFDLFSKREKNRQMAGKEDVFQYDHLPQPFRVQVAHILTDALGSARRPFSHMAIGSYSPIAIWGEIFRILIREMGVINLNDPQDDPETQCLNHILKAPTNDVLDIIELSFRYSLLLKNTADTYTWSQLRLSDPDDAIGELNTRFREHGIGYEFANQQIIRVDSKYIHAESVRPALQLLNDAGSGFVGPLQEFLEAHDHHQRGEFKQSVISACKAFESTLKAICAAQGWAFDQHQATASKLLKLVFDNELVPSYLQEQFTTLRCVLESGVPTARNKTSGHGQGTIPTGLPEHFVAFVLHLTASNIVYLVKCSRSIEKNEP